MYIISGCNGAGKTTAAYTMLPELLDCREYVNSDEFAKFLAPFQPEKAAIGASRFMVKKYQYLMEKGKDFCIETTLATRSLLKMVKRAQAQGYTVTLIYFWLSSPELAISRVAARVAAGGHNIPEETIRRRYRTGLVYFFNDYTSVCDRWILADNSCPPFSVIADGSRDGEVSIKNKELFSRIQIYALSVTEDSDDI